MLNFMLVIFLSIFSLNACSKGQNGNSKLSAKEFSQKITETPSAVIVDVRTPAEFSKGHLKNAKNINWNDDNFQKQISEVEKSKPVFVYCLSGGRSSSAASKMRSLGFKEVYEMDGGMMQWRSASLPETTESASVLSGMTKEQFSALLNTDKLVLVDFYADWCAPCKRMTPFLEEIRMEMADKVTIVRINADESQELAKKMKIEALPTLFLYKNKEIIWQNVGFTSKEELVQQIK